MRYMLDTNICIYLLAGGWTTVKTRFSKLHVGDALISTVVLAELRAGIEKSTTKVSDERALSALLDELSVMPFDEAAAVSYGIVRVQVPSRQRNALDRLIAAHALSLDAVLVTNNTADFEVYPGLRIENWAVQTA